MCAEGKRTRQEAHILSDRPLSLFFFEKDKEHNFCCLLRTTAKKNKDMT